MARYIDIDDTVKTFEKLHGEESTLLNCYNADWIFSFLESQPTADVQEVRHGKWRSEIVKITDWRGKEQSYYQPNSCSICHTGLRVRTNFCPNCGAKMDGKE